MDDRDPIRREHLAAGAIYGIIAYLAILVLLEEDHTDPSDAIAILVGSAIVYWLAHVYAHLLPRMAAVGRLRSGRFWETAVDQIGILLVVLVPVVPLLLGVLGILSGKTAVRTAIAAGIASLGVFAIREARTAGLGWRRSLLMAAGLVLAGVSLLWFEVSLH
jgi:hypothetical protein